MERNMKKYKLDWKEGVLIGQGKYRIVCQHPEYQNRVVKFDRTDRPNLDGNKREFEGYSLLQPLLKKYFPNLYGFDDFIVDGKIAKGLVYEKIINYDNTKSMTVREMFVSKNNDLMKFKEQIEVKMKEMLFDLANNNFYCGTFGLGLENILVQKISDNEIKVMSVECKKLYIGKSLFFFKNSEWYCKIRLRNKARKMLRTLKRFYDEIAKGD